MATFNKFEQFVTDLAEGVHDNALTADTDTLKLMLTNTAPDAAADVVKADITEIAAGNGYTAGGEDVSNAFSKSGDTITISVSDVTWSATGSIGPFRYAVLYNDTPASPAKPLIGWWDYGSSLTLSNGDTFKADFGASAFTIG